MNENIVNMAASALTSWKSYNGKHPMEHSNEDDSNNPMKRARMETAMAMAAPQHVDSVVAMKPQLRPYPFFYYTDYSTEPDPDPLTPLTFPGRVPNFPAKLHAILSQPEFIEVIDWLPHGRSWRVLKPREFEQRIIPKFFEHSKFSSFVRQANGWGFRRITQGPDRNSYYHEKFLRGLPHLCKTMKRPGVAEKRVVDPDLEPDFYKIAQIHPVPDRADEESIFLQKTLESGPKSRMPIVTGHFSKGDDEQPASVVSDESKPSSPVPTEQQQQQQQNAPAEVQVPASNRQAPSTGQPTSTNVPHGFRHGTGQISYHGAAPAPSATYQAPVSAPAPGVSAYEVKHERQQQHPSHQSQQQAHQQAHQQQQHSSRQQQPIAPAPANYAQIQQVSAPTASSAAAAPGQSSTVSPDQPSKVGEFPQMPFHFPSPDPNSPAASSFAAGFAAATAHYQQQFYAMMSKMAKNGQLPEGFNPNTFMAKMGESTQ